MKDVQRHDFRIDLRGMIKLLAKNLYPEEDIFVREMLQNAHDSIQRRSEEDKARNGFIRVRLFPFDRRIAFEDNGRGMTENEINDYLSTIGRSGTDEFRQQLIQLGRKAEVSLIGQFGIGLLSCFVVADKVEVITRSSQPNQPAWRWSSCGDKDYVLREVEYDHTGTTVTLTIAHGKGDIFLQEEDIRKTIRKYADFLPFPIYLNNDKVPVNTIIPPWAKVFDTEEEQYAEYKNFVDARFPDYILHIVPVHAKDPYSVNGILYVTDRRPLDLAAPGPIDVYQNRMFVQARNRELLPTWATFIGGIIDSPDLTLTASRDRLVQDSIFHDIQNALGDIIIQALIDLKKQDSAKLHRLLRWHQLQIKGMSIRHEAFFAAIADFVPFETNRGSMDLQTYLQQPQSVDPDGRHRIFYFTESGSATQFYMLCDEKGLLVINASFAFEEKFLEKYSKGHPEIKLHQINIAGSEFIFSRLSDDEMARYRPLELEFRRIIDDPRDSFQIVRFHPTNLPVVAMLGSEAKLYKELEETREDVVMPDSIRKLVGRVLEETPSIPIIFYINADNPIIQRVINLDLRTEIVVISLRAICSNAIFLAAGRLPKNSVEMMFHDFTRVIDFLLNQTTELEQTRTWLSKAQLALEETEQKESPAELTSHVSCFVAMPFGQEYDYIFMALRQLLEDRPYYWQVIRADERQFEATISGNVHQHIARAHCYFVEISEDNFNVGLELGWIQNYKGRPIILLRKEDAQKVPADIQGAIYVSYPATHKLSPTELVELLRRELNRVEALKDVRSSTHYLSPLLLSQSGIDSHVAEVISEWFSSSEEFLAADPRSVAERLNKGQYLIESVQKYIRDSLGDKQK